MRYTVIGGHGFIGTEICSKLKKAGHDVFIPKKDDSALFLEDLGVVIYCAGYGDCASNPFKVIESNVISLANVVERGIFQKLIYLSSTRLYLGNDSSLESDDLLISSTDKRRLFNLTKLVAEEVCLLSKKNITIVRPSNVYGMALKSPLYLPSIIRNAIIEKRIDMYVSKQYAKDYISVEDLADAVYRLTLCEKLGHKIYNIASGINVSSFRIAEVIQNHTGCDVVWHEIDVNNEEKFPETNIKLTKNSIDFSTSYVLDDLPLMISKFKRILTQIKKTDKNEYI